MRLTLYEASTVRQGQTTRPQREYNIADKKRKFAIGPLSPRVWRLLYFLTAATGLKNIHIKKSAIFIRARSTKEMSPKQN